MAIPTEQEMMITLIFGTGALIVGLYYFVMSYASGLKEVYGYGQSKTIYEVVAGTLLVHIALIVISVLFVNTFEIMTGFDLYGGIAKILKYDWFGLINQIPAGRSDLETVSILLGYIKFITTAFLGIAPVAIFFTIVSKQFSECVRQSKQSQTNKGFIACGMDIVIPAVFFLTVYFIHLTFASVLIGGGDYSNPDHDFLRQIGINWWRQVMVLHPLT